MSTEMSEYEIAAAAAVPFDAARADLIPGDRDTARKTVSARVPDAVAQWVITEAVRARVTPSSLIADLLAEAIDARREVGAQGPRKLVDVADVHRLLDTIARAA